MSSVVSTFREHIKHIQRPNKSAKLEARCSPVLRQQFLTIATVREADISDIVREACVDYVARFRTRLEPQTATH